VPKGLISPAHLIATALAAMTVALGSSYFGDLGTLLGAGLTAIIGASAAAVYEHLVQKFPVTLRRRGLWFTLRHAHLRISPSMLTAALASSVVLLGCVFAVILVTQASAGRSIHSIVTGHSGAQPAQPADDAPASTAPPAPSPSASGPQPTISASVSPSSAAPSDTIPPSASPTLTPSASPDAPQVSASATPLPSFPASPEPSTTGSALP
jgi:hypothetical protein